MEEAIEKLALETVEQPATNANPTDSFAVIDYVRELFLNSEEQKKIEQKKLKLIRVCVALLSFVSLVVLASAVILVPKLLTTVTEANDLAPENWTSYNVRKKRKKTNKGAERRWQERTSQSSRSSSSYGK